MMNRRQNDYRYEKLAEPHKKIFEQYQNTMGERMSAEFLHFLDT